MGYNYVLVFYIFHSSCVNNLGCRIVWSFSYGQKYMQVSKVSPRNRSCWQIRRSVCTSRELGSQGSRCWPLRSQDLKWLKLSHSLSLYVRSGLEVCRSLNIIVGRFLFTHALYYNYGFRMFVRFTNIFSHDRMFKSFC